MVLLSFLVEIDSPFQEVWKYFQKLQNVPEWDPNVKKVELIQSTGNQTGSLYNLTSSFYSKQSNLRYQIMQSNETPDRGYRRFQGQNSMIKAIDEVIVVKQTNNTSRIQWKVNLTLKSFYWLFTPLAYFGFKKLQTDGRQGCVKKAIQLYGKARQIQ